MRIFAPYARVCFVAMITTFPLAGCGAVLPELKPIAGSQPDPNNPYSVSINEVVKRVKCEVWLSVKDRPEKAYPWFNKWTAQADLTLTVNDSSGINPGATFIEPLAVATTSRSLGLGGGLTSTAFRTEIVSFSMSVADLRKEFEKANAYAKFDGCDPYSATDLNGRLGLVEWVNSAFGPIDNQLLSEGSHAAPKAPNGTQGGAPPPPKGLTAQFAARDLLKAATASPEPPKIPEGFPLNLSESIRRIYAEYNVLTDAMKFTGTALEDISEKRESDAYFADLSKDLASEIEKAKTEGAAKAVTTALENYRKKIVSDITPAIGTNESRLRKLVADSQAFLGNMAVQITGELAPVIPMAQLQCDCYPDQPHYSDDGAKVLKCLNTIQSLAKLLTPVKPSKNPPIDAISHQVNFVVAWSGSVNPTWTLVRFKGPSPSSGNFASVSESNTHNLTIVMGAPGSAAAANARSALTLSANLATQLAPQLGMTPSIVP